MQQQDQSENIEAAENTDIPSEEAVTERETDALSKETAEHATEISPEEKSAELTEEQAAAENSFFKRAKASEQPQRGNFDWSALIAALAVAAFFALTARFNSQPSPSYIPAAVFSATGCGLLVTAIRKLRRRTGVGLLEAGISGFGMALFQFLMTFTYPSVWTTVTTVPDYGRAFFLTWGLIALFAVVLSLAGATIGHLAFSPLRSLPARAQKQSNMDDEDEDDETQENDNEPLAQSASASENTTTPPAPFAEPAEQTGEIDEGEDEDAQDEGEGDSEEQTSTAVEGGNDEEQANEDEEEIDELADVADEDDEEAGAKNGQLAAAMTQPRRSLPNYAITVLLLGLLPMMAGYVFAATYDFLMNAINVDSISPALYPTLSLLSGLLPWRLAAPITLSGQNGAFIVFTLLWRVPDSVLGNPNLFDVQALETLVFNAAGLALLLIAMYNSDNHNNQRQSAPWGIFIFLEALFGLILVLPANLWLLRGLEGVLQMGSLVVKLPTIQLLNPVLFALNLVTGMVLCLIIGLIVRRQYQLWTTPRVKTPVQPEEDFD
jgi:hypothetical protein